MYEIPITVEVDGQSYAIRNKGDFRMVLDCFVALNDIELTKEERLYSALIIFYDGFKDVSDLGRFTNLEEAVKKMYQFFNCGREDEFNNQHMSKLLDWKKDEQLVVSAVNKVAGKEIRLEPYLHWWTFIGYYIAIGSSALSTVVGIRYKIVNQKKLEKWEQQFRRENPQYFVWDSKSVQEKELDELARNLWNSGSD